MKCHHENVFSLRHRHTRRSYSREVCFSGGKTLPTFNKYFRNDFLLGKDVYFNHYSDDVTES